VYSAVPKLPDQYIPMPSPEPDERGRRPVGVSVDGRVLRGFPTPSGRLEFYSTTLAQWGWRECAIPTYLRSHVHWSRLEPGEMPLISTFRLPVSRPHAQCECEAARWIAHTNPLWLHPLDADRLGVRTGDLVRVATKTGHFVVKAWVTEGIRPGVVACSHHMGRWKLSDAGQRQMMRTVSLTQSGGEWDLATTSPAGPFGSADPDTRRIWWTDVGVHQNLAFPVQPDPVSGMHCWHQAVRGAGAGRRLCGDIAVNTVRAHEIFGQWLTPTRGAHEHRP
jgi:anaerobic selenocysteine-containing dehydrogenase